MRHRYPQLAALVVLLVAGCAARPAGPASPLGGSDSGRDLAVVDIATNLAVPWGLDFLPGGDALVTERDSARLLRVTPRGQVSPVGTVPGVPTGPVNSEGGVLGLALSPSFGTDRLVYVYFSTATENRIERFTYGPDGRLGPGQPVLAGIPSAVYHDGGRIAFGPDGMLYVGTGDATDAGLAQDPASLGGKVLRLTPDGAAAPGNPFPGSPVYSLGHRNVQGLAFDSAGRLWASEFGANAWDELNLIRPGGNYGWPLVEGPGDRFIQPAAYWPVAEASPSGIAIVGDQVWMAATRGERLWRIPIEGAGAGAPVAFLTGRLGRLRTVARAPDGALWVTTSNRDGRGRPRPGDDRIVRVDPTS